MSWKVKLRLSTRQSILMSSRGQTATAVQGLQNQLCWSQLCWSHAVFSSCYGPNASCLWQRWWQFWDPAQAKALCVPVGPAHISQHLQVVFSGICISGRGTKLSESFFRHWRFIGVFSGICVFHTAFVVLRCASQALKGSKMLSLCWRIAYTKESNAAWHKFERNNIQMYTDALFFSVSQSVFSSSHCPLS